LIDKNTNAGRPDSTKSNTFITARKSCLAIQLNHPIASEVIAMDRPTANLCQ